MLYFRANTGMASAFDGIIKTAVASKKNKTTK
jgi:hypothetical protein